MSGPTGGSPRSGRPPGGHGGGRRRVSAFRGALPRPASSSSAGRNRSAHSAASPTDSTSRYFLASSTSRLVLGPSGIDSANSWDHYNKWNDLVIPLKPVVTVLVEEKSAPLLASRPMPKVFLGDVRWQILHACMETEYSYVVPPGQFYALTRWYIAGHFPCGWRGEWPEGKLIVY